MSEIEDRLVEALREFVREEIDRQSAAQARRERAGTLEHLISIDIDAEAVALAGAVSRRLKIDTSRNLMRAPDGDAAP